MRLARWIGHSGVMEMMAQQLGLAMIPDGRARSAD